MLIALIVAVAVPLETIVNVPLVANEVGSAPAPPVATDDGDKEYKLAYVVFDPFVHVTEPTFVVAEFATVIELALPGVAVASDKEIPDIVGAVTITFAAVDVVE